MNAAPIARHRWIEIAPTARSAVTASSPEGHRNAVDAWLRRGLPLVARSRQPGEPAHGQPAGLSLPLARGKLKIALHLDPAHIERHGEPTALDQVAEVLAPSAGEVAHELAAQASALGFTARAFGSAAWQWRSGDIYLHAGSDLDVLAAPPDAASLQAWIACLRAAEARLPMRIDGEVELRSGEAINWRELAGPSRRVLVKSPSGARLAERATVEAAWT